MGLFQFKADFIFYVKYVGNISGNAVQFFHLKDNQKI